MAHLHWNSLAVFLLCALPSAPGAAAQERPWRVVQELRIGSLDDERTALTRVSVVAVAPDLTLYVAQPMESLIRVFDSGGRYVRSIGRGGQGPGEFGFLDQIGLRADTLWAVDLRLNRISRFARDGSHLRTDRLDPPQLGEDFLSIPPIGSLADGSVIARATYSMARASSSENFQVPIVLLDHQGRMIGRFPSLNLRGDTRQAPIPGGSAYVGAPVRSSDIVRVAPDGSSVVYVRRPLPTRSDQAAFSVLKMRTPTDTVFLRSYRYTPRPIPRQAADSLRSGVVDFLDRWKSRAEAQRFIRDSNLMPQYQPGISSMMVGDGGTIWLGREVLGERAIRWLSLNARGEIGGHIVVPANVRLLAARGDRVWGVETGEWGVEYVVRYRVER
ncbi:MAG: 6-bladed beta-propeller [Gemmatimonadetes bacterium]|nr:6-bladed beta-propeller [Gemmatimonadota bacterium]